MMQTILGSGGGIGIPLARELKQYTDRIRLVSRNPKKVNDTDELFPADVTDPARIEAAIAGSSVVYVTVGFEYNLKVWQKTWPGFMDAVVTSCIRNKTRLVFFDNVYIYSRGSIPFMTENSEINPPSEKGKVRKIVREIIMNAVEKGNLEALIARAADFYGPENRNSPLTIMVAANLIKGKKAQVFGNIDKIHTYTYTPDAAKATALLGNTPDAYNQEWHVPTTKEKLTNLNWIGLFADALGKKAGIQKVTPFMLRLIGIFVPIMREFPEMMYQYEQDYVFDSSKFEKRFGIYASPPAEGVSKVVEYLSDKL